MRFLSRLAVNSLATLLCAAHVAGAAPDARRPAVPAGARIVDDTQHIDINNISMPVTNTGSFTWDRATGNAGLEYPKGSGKKVVFVSGLWLGARVAGTPRVTTSGYFDEFQPGAVAAGVADDPAKPEYKVYRLERSYASTAARDAALADYVAGAVSHGAQGVPVLAGGTLDIPGDQMCWSVYNDLDAAQHISQPGSTAPLGVEVQQTTFAFNRAGALGSTVFTRFRIFNRGTQPLSEVYAGMWADPDIGGFSDDLAGCDPSLGLGYCYNATNTDVAYGATPPAVGFDFVQGPTDPVTHQPRSLTAFDDFTASDPLSALESFNALAGLEASGAPIIDPTTTLATHFRHPGNPVLHTGWLDATPGDKHLLVASGPFTLPPGAYEDVIVAIVVAQGADRLGSISLLKTYDSQAQSEFDSGTLIRLGVGEHAPLGFALERPWPNPTRGAMSVAFSLPDAEPASLELLDVAGRSVARQAVSSLGPGRHVITLAPDGARLPAGLYWVRLMHSGHSLIAKAVITR